MLRIFGCCTMFFFCEVCVFFLLWDVCASGVRCLVPALAALFEQSLQPLVVKSAVTVYPAPALVLQGVWSQFFVPLCCSCLFSSLAVFSSAFCHLGLLSHTILLLFLAWGSSFGVCSGLGLRCCSPGLDPPFFCGKGGGTLFPLSLLF